jgi:hypothetical protein
VTRSLRRLGLIVATAVAVAGCGSSGALDASSLSPSSSPAGVATAPPEAATPSPVPSPSTGATQSDTAWGRIWDSLPASFPAVPGGTASEEGATGAASGVYTFQGQKAKDVAALMQRLLSSAGYSTLGLSGPLEDGSYVVDMSGQPQGCKVQASVDPTGSVTTLTILYGATCPHS